jgi:uncharacterized protein YbjT (DUF2867 family)
LNKKKIIAVVGATGAQGGSLARAILSDPDSEFSVRAITRDAESEKSKELARLGAELVVADINDSESLKKAFEGAYGAFCVTFFWNHFSPEIELQSAKNQAEAAKAANIKHVIWSSLDDTRNFIPLSDNRMPTLMGKYKVPHFDAKGEADNFFIESGLPVTILLTVFYWENFIYFGLGPQKGSDGKYTITLPLGDKKMPSIAYEDIGKCAYSIFKKGNEFINKKIGIAGGHLTGTEFASQMSNALGVDIAYNSISPDDYRSFNTPGADEMGNMFQFKADFEKEYCQSRSIELARSLNPELQSFKQWLEKNKDKIPL